MAQSEKGKIPRFMLIILRIVDRVLLTGAL